MSMLEYEYSPRAQVNDFWSVSNSLNFRLSSSPVLYQGRLYVKNINSIFEENEYYLTSKYLYYRNEINSIIMAKIKWCLLESYYESSPEGLDYGFSIVNSNGKHDFYTQTSDSLEKWLFYLSAICIMTDFDQDFIIIKEINHGRYGKVSLCHDAITGTEFAVKEIMKDFQYKENQIVNLRNEIKTLKKVNHENCVKLYRIYEDSNAFYMIMEYVKYGNLLERLVSIRIYTESEALKLIKRLLGVIEYLHSLGIIHRDIKLENILMASNSNNTDFKLADFGLATCIEKLHKTKCGSPGFMAPEIINGSYYSLKADIYSIGVVLYILLSGKQPFYSKSLQSILEKNKRGKVKYTGNAWKSISAFGCNFVSILLSKDPNLRPTAEQALLHPWLNAVAKSQSEFPTLFYSQIPRS